MGVSGSLPIEWLRYYLTYRTQQVRIGPRLSRTIFPESGAPQGSHLGPLLFALFINDLCTVLIDSEFLFYADDLKIYRSISSNHDADALQRDLTRIRSWCDRNAMTLNVNKCEVI